MPTSASAIPPRYHGLSVDRESYKRLVNDGFRYDMVDGVLFLAPSPFYRHNENQFRFLSALSEFLGKRSGIRMVADVDLFLPDGEDVLCPDISVLLPENTADTNSWITGVPDLIAEVLSDSTRQRDTGTKAERYLQNGVREYWLLDPNRNRVQVWYNSGSSWKKSKTGNSRLFPGFRFQIS